MTESPEASASSPDPAASQHATTMAPEVAAQLAARDDFVWHQRFELAPEVFTRGANDIGWLLQQSGLPEDLSDCKVLDIGTTNGGGAFLAERRGAARCLAVDIFDSTAFGFADLAAALDSSAEFLQCNVYDVPDRVDGAFDHVLFLGVLYHLRHPLLALDAVRHMLAPAGVAYIETAVCDGEVEPAGSGVVRYYRRDELGHDASNWFAPSVATLRDWCESAGLDVQEVRSWPEDRPTRALVRARRAAGEPEFEKLSYERRFWAERADD